MKANDQVDMAEVDEERVKSWIYPTNYPSREYQYNIIQKALLNNTLVSLPTGLGKTFIAAVVMYNFYCWYPRSKIIFMAPTKPLVQQQIDACYKIMGIPMESTAVLTGKKATLSRANIWQEKRVFYVTPQVLQNDLNKITELGASIKCIVFDEAHKALGNYAYCNVVKQLVAQGHTHFRTLALTATPGSNVGKVIQVIRNLLISHLEFRTEDSIDVQPYVFKRSIETIVVPLSDKLKEIKDKYVKILEHYTKTLRTHNVIYGNCSNLTKGQVFLAMKSFQNEQRGSLHYSEIMRCLNISVTLYHAFDLLIRHGLRSFLSFFSEHIEKPLLRCDTNLKSIMDEVRQFLGPYPNIPVLPEKSSTNAQILKDIIFGHPKYYKLKEVLCSHFENAHTPTKVIVFFEYRESVMEAHTLLLDSGPLIKTKIFIGQNSGITQKTQIGVIQAFREGQCNTLLSTCIGEEGLDVGEVDLIVCFDVSTKSPIRMVQRMGRTGRKRDGRVLILVTQGREQQTLKDCLNKSSRLSTLVLQSKELKPELYSNSPRMVPNNVIPKCENKFIDVKPIVEKKKGKLRSAAERKSKLQNVEATEVKERLPKVSMLFNKSNFGKITSEENKLFQNNTEQQRTAQKTSIIGHSEDSKLPNVADCLRFNIPPANSEFHKSKNLKQSNIKDMFKNIGSQADFQNTRDSHRGSIKELPVIDLDDFVPDASLLPFHLTTMLSDYLFELKLTDSKTNKYDGTEMELKFEKFQMPSDNFTKNLDILIPSERILDTINLSSLKSFATDCSFSDCMLEMELLGDEYASIFEHVDLMQLESRAVEVCNNLISSDGSVIVHNNHEIENNIFADDNREQNSSSSASILDNNGTEIDDISKKQLLIFFNLTSLNDIFDNSSVECMSQNHEDENERSPIISSGAYRRNNKRKNIEITNSFRISECGSCAVSPVIDDAVKENEDIDLSEFCDLSYYGHHSEEKFTNNTKGCSEAPNMEMSKKVDENKIELDDLSELCDLTYFGLSETKETIKNDEEETNDGLNPDNICNSSVYQPNDENFETNYNESIFEINKSCQEAKKSNGDIEGNTSSKYFPSPCIPKSSLRKKFTRARKKAISFLDLEAQVTRNENEVLSNDEDVVDSDADLEQSFVDNATQACDTEMQVVYLKSIKSPKPKKNLFTKPKYPINRDEIYSQAVPDEMSAYLEDSFCVNQDDSGSPEQLELSELEFLEQKLNSKRKNKETKAVHPKRKKKRVYCISSDSE